MIGEQIARARMEKKWSQTKLGELSEVSREQINRYENNRVEPDRETLKKIARALEVSLDFLYGTAPDGFIPIKRGVLPIVGDIACGTPITAVENIEGYTDLPEGIKADFALRCKGDSMEPTFHNGDLVLIRQQPDVNDGQIAVVLIDGEATLKHVYKEPGGLLLVADNPKYAPIRLTETESEYAIIQGLAVGFTRMFKE